MAQAAADRDYTDFEPAFEWVQEEASDTLIVNLPGFRRDQLRVQVTSAPLLRISGERQINLNTYTRFTKEFPIPSSYDTNRITAKFEGGQLHVNIPKLVPQATPEVPSKRGEQKEEPKADEANSQKEKEQPSDQAAAAAAAAGAEAEKKKVRTNGPVETVEASGTSSKPNNERGAAKVVQRLKTHFLDLSQSMRRGGADDDQDKKEVAAPAGKQSNKKKLLNLFVAILMFVVLGLYVKNAFKSSVGSKFKEL